MIIEITEEDIKNGRKKNVYECPIALALRRIFPEERILVWHGGLKIGEKTYYSNKEIHDFVVVFDKGKEVKPFNFDLDNLWIQGKV